MPIMRMMRDADAAGPEEAGKGIPLRFTAATAGVKGDGKDLGALPFDFSRGVAAPSGGAVRFPFLWVHDLAGHNLPLGVADVLTAPDELPARIAVQFDPDDEFAVKVERKYRSPVGGLNGVSVSWDDVDASGQTTRVSGKPAAAWQLLEVSAVPVGLDGDALKDGARVRSLLSELGLLDAPTRMLPGSDEAHTNELIKALRESEAIPGATSLWPVSTFDDRVVVSVSYADMGAESAYFSVPYTEADGGFTFGEPTPVDITYTAIEQPKGKTAPAEPAADADTTEDDAPDEGRAWANVAADMVAVFAPGCPDDDRARRRRYNTLTARYRKLGRTPPEFLTADEVAALGADEWRGLWLEEEMSGARVGAVLNARNTELLTGARDAIDTVLRSAQGGKADDDERGFGRREMDPEMADMLAGIMATLDKIAAAVAPDDEAEDEAEPDAMGAVADDERATDDDAERAAILAAARAQLKVVANG